MSDPFVIYNWYWSVGDQSPGTQVYSTASNSFVPTSDTTYTAWVGRGNVATVIDTMANLYGVFNDNCLAAYVSKSQSFSSSVDITLTNPPPSSISVTMNAASKKVKLPRMDTPSGIPTGRNFDIINAGSTNTFTVALDDGTSVIDIVPGRILTFTLLANTSRNGMLQVSGGSIAQGGGGTFISDSPPTNPSPGAVWWESDTGKLWMWYNDGTSAQWVTAAPPGPQGPVGPTGSVGPTGATGAQGATGAPGVTPKAFSAHKGGVDQTGIASNTLTKCTFTSTHFNDATSGYDAANSRWTPPAGKILLAASLNGQNMTSGNAFAIHAYKNGASFKSHNIVLGSSFSAVSLSFVDQANGTDYYEIFGIGVTSTSLTFASGTSCFFTGTFLG